ncbi:MAG: FAD-dependent oxidoreductase [Actinomycetota bacterium]
MKNTAQVVVIGGGVVGASVLYHLTKAGWTDVVLVERTELTAGSTWHSAGGMHTLNGDPNVAKLQQYTIELYKEIEEISEQDCSIHITGGVMLADTPERMEWLRMSHARGKYLGMETELISVAEAKELLPIFEEKYFVGAMYDAHEGHVDPTGVTNAYAKAARQAGAEIYRDTWARDINRQADGTWRVDLIKTSTGDDIGHITCDHVVNAGGLWAREVGRMAGIEAPVLAMEHIYIVTEPLQEVADWNASTGTEMLHAIDFGGEIYMRQEQGGLLLGTYEPNGRPWSIEETPWEFGMKLLDPNLDYIADSLQRGFDHFPIFARSGIKSVINGPFTFSPDGNPLLGPVRGLPGYWSACAVMAGLSQGGGVGLALANWITEGDPGFDVWAMDISRYGDYASMAWTNTKVRENYGRRFRIRYPNEFLLEGRPLMTSPIYDRLVDANAVWGDSYGLESAQWFQKPGLEPIEDFTFGRSNAWDQVRAETLNVRENVGLMETTGFSKFEFTGPGAREYLDKLFTNTVPRAGRMVLAPMTNEAGKLIGDLTVAAVEPAVGVAEGPKATVTGGATQNTAQDDRFFVFGSGIAERYYERWFDQHLPGDGSVQYRTWGWEMCGLSIAGPKSRELLGRVTSHDVSKENFRFMEFRELEIGWAKVWCGRVTYSGDLGYEFWMPSSLQRYVFDTLMEAGEDLGIGLFGSAALNSLRLEKSFGSWAREFRPLYTPYEANLGRFVKLDKPGGFIGRDALAAHREDGPTLRLLTFDIEALEHDVIGDEPIFHGDEVVGWVTSGGYAHAQNKSIALGYVPEQYEGMTDGWQIEVCGEMRPATQLTEVLWDPQAERMRG